MAPIGVHFTTRQAKDPVVDVQNIRLWDNGVTWKDIAVGPGHYEWDLLDHLVFERYKGKNITYVLHATPQWAAQKPNAAHEIGHALGFYNVNRPGWMDIQATGWHVPKFEFCKE